MAKNDSGNDQSDLDRYSMYGINGEKMSALPKGITLTSGYWISG